MDGLVLPFDSIGALENNNDVWLNDYVHSKGHGNYTYSVNPNNVYLANGTLNLQVDPPVGDTVGSAQLSTLRKDLWYGTYRSVIQLPPQSGSCVGLFYYYNDTEEIDVEYISQNPNMLYFSSKRTNPNDFSADIDANNYMYKNGSLNVFRDYRFDWFPDRVDFYVDNKKTYTSTGYSPSTPARAMLMNWGNGDADWSGLPKETIIAKFKNLRVFFNSTHPYIVQNYQKACMAAKTAGVVDAICNVADFATDKRYGYAENVIRRFAVNGVVGQPISYTNDSSTTGSAFSGAEITTARVNMGILLSLCIIIVILL